MRVKFFNAVERIFVNKEKLAEERKKDALYSSTWIEFFLKNNEGNLYRTYNVDGQSVAIIEEKEMETLKKEDFEIVKEMLKLESGLREIDINRRCYYLAEDMIKKGFADGMLHCSNIKQRIVPMYRQHTINYKILEDGSYLGVDFTSRLNIDGTQGNFNIFCVRAKSLSELLKKVEKLFGGNWRVENDKVFKQNNQDSPDF
jgi:hypothetical protein